MFSILILFFKTGLSQCPSWYRNNDVSTGCWEYDEAAKTCNMANPACGSIECGHAWISSELRADVFGLSEWDLEMHVAGVKKLTANGDDCSSITWDETNNLFRVNTTLMDCNMNAERIMINDQSYWSFQHTIERPEDWLFGRRTAMNISVGLECRYPSTVLATTASFTGVPSTLDKMLQLDTKIPTSLEPNDDLLIPESPAFTQAATLVTKSLMENFQGEIQPISVEVLEFIFNTKLRTDLNVEVVVRFIFPNLSGESAPTEETAEVMDLKAAVIQVLEVMADAENETFVINEFDPALAEIGLNVVSNIHYGTFVGYGEMSSGFKLQIYSDAEFRYPANKILLGRTIYAKADWTSALHNMKFYINDCSYQCPKQGSDELDSIYIVKDTCYAAVVQTRLTTPNNRKVVSDTSSFSFKSFMFERGQLAKGAIGSSCQIECTIDTCLSGVLCLPPLECDTEGVEFMEFTPFGYGH